MKVLFVTGMHPSARFPLRGLGVVRLADALGRLGHEVRTATLRDGGGPLRYLRARSGVASVVREFQPAIVHAHFGYSGLAVPWLRQPLVTTFNGDDLNGTTTARGGITLKSVVGICVSQWVAQRSTRCIAVSASLRGRLWLERSRAKTVVIRDPIDPAVFRPLDRGEARRRLDLGAEDTLILFPHDAAQPNKRVELAKASVEHLRAWEPRARLWIVNGRAPEEMPWYYAAADAMIITSAREGGPTSAKEALACGIPVVSVPVGDLDLFAEAPEAMTRAGPDPRDLALALRRTLHDAPPTRRSHLPRELMLESVARATVEVYDRALCHED